MTSFSAVPAAGPFEPEPCVTAGRAPSRPAAVAITVIVVVWFVLAVHGVPPQAAAAGLSSAVGLGLRIAARSSMSRKEQGRG
jgi:hypothetical protein